MQKKKILFMWKVCIRFKRGAVWTYILQNVMLHSMKIFLCVPKKNVYKYVSLQVEVKGRLKYNIIYTPNLFSQNQFSDLIQNRSYVWGNKPTVGQCNFSIEIWFRLMQSNRMTRIK